MIDHTAYASNPSWSHALIYIGTSALLLLLNLPFHVHAHALVGLAQLVTLTSFSTTTTAIPAQQP